MSSLQPRHLFLLIGLLIVGYLLLSRNRGRIAATEAHQLVSAGATLLDVRSPAEFASGHIDGAINIPVDQLAGRVEELGDPKEPVILYCASGMRSGRAVGVLRGKGFTAAHNLGGMSNW